MSCYPAFGNGQAVVLEESELDDDETGESGRARSDMEAEQSRKRGMVLPFEPHSITFDEIVYSVDMPQVLLNFKVVTYILI